MSIVPRFGKVLVDHNEYPKGVKVSDEELNEMNISQEEWHGEWNYVIKPKNA